MSTTKNTVLFDDDNVGSGGYADGRQNTRTPLSDKSNSLPHPSIPRSYGAPSGPPTVSASSTQTDFRDQPTIISYDSDDEMVRHNGKRRASSSHYYYYSQHRTKKGHPIYSREDIREQYCITSKELEAFESAAYGSGSRLFGCLSMTHLLDASSCKNSLLCVKRRGHAGWKG